MYYRPKIFFPKKTYSSFGEDIAVRHFFKNKKKGFYVDIGCYHPLEGSNTYLLYKDGWHGLNVDINERSIQLFNVSRKRDLNFNYAISSESKKVKVFYRKQINMLNTIVKKKALTSFKKGFKSSYIKAVTLNYLFKTANMKNNKIDFLNIDVEGNELKVLKSLNFKSYTPKLICIEIHNFKRIENENFYKSTQIYKFLMKKNYELFWRKGFSFIFKTKS